MPYSLINKPVTYNIVLTREAGGWTHCAIHRGHGYRAIARRECKIVAVGRGYSGALRNARALLRVSRGHSEPVARAILADAIPRSP